MPPMQTTQHVTTGSSTTTSFASHADRRTRLRLRDLCDEVIASYRAATGGQLLSDDERAEANALLGRMVPGMARRSA